MNRAEAEGVSLCLYRLVQYEQVFGQSEVQIVYVQVFCGCCLIEDTGRIIKCRMRRHL